MMRFCYQLPYELFTYDGTSCWLVRVNPGDLLPKSITEDWLRYEVQNSDCFLRIRREWSSQWEDMLKRIR